LGKAQHAATNSGVSRLTPPFPKRADKNSFLLEKKRGQGARSELADRPVKQQCK